jgi:non-homologous end joining protein Ku
MIQQKPYASLTFQLGLFGLTAEAVPVRVTNSTKAVAFKNICPDCAVPTLPKQLYRCDAGHEHTSGELAKARLEGKELIPVSAEVVEKVKAPDVIAGVMELQACPAAELEASTLPDDTAYRIRPDKKNAKNYALMLGLAGDPETALYGVVKLGASSPKPYRLKVWEGQLIVQSLIRPENVAERDEIDVVEPEAKLVSMAQALVEAVKEPFNAALLADTRLERLEKLMANLPACAPVEEAAAEDPDDLMALLEAALDAASA